MAQSLAPWQDGPGDGASVAGPYYAHGGVTGVNVAAEPETFVSAMDNVLTAWQTFSEEVGSAICKAASVFADARHTRNRKMHALE